MVTEYLDYFKTLASLHPDIQHDISAEGLDGDPSKVRFATFWEADVFSKTPPSGLTNAAPSLALHLLDGTLSDTTNNWDVRSRLNGGFVISERVTVNDRHAEQQAYINCEQIMLDFLVALREQSTDFCGVGAIHLETIQFFQVGPLWDNRFGWWCKFEFSFPLKLQDRPNVFTT